MSNFRPNLAIFGIVPDDAGWIYVLRNQNLIKIGRSNNPNARLRECKTWIPDVEIIGVKPFWNVSAIEKTMHEGLVRNWHKGEWFNSFDEAAKALFIEGFLEFYDDDRDMNSIDFIYWWNSSGFAEFSIEKSRQNLNSRQWRKQETISEAE